MTYSNRENRCYSGRALIDNYNWPPRYNESRLILMVRDPQCIFAYWDYNEKQYYAFVNRFYKKNTTWQIRIYNTALFGTTIGSSSAYNDIPVSVHAQSIYINVTLNNVLCCASLGIQTNKGQFHTFIQSNTIEIPRKIPQSVLQPIQPPPLAVDREKENDKNPVQPYSSANIKRQPL